MRHIYILLVLIGFSFLGCGSGSSENTAIPTITETEETLADIIVLDVNNTITTGASLGQVTIPTKINDTVETVGLVDAGSANFNVSTDGVLSTKKTLKKVSHSTEVDFEKTVRSQITYSFRVKVTYSSGKIVYIKVQITVYTYRELVVEDTTARELAVEDTTAREVVVEDTTAREVAVEDTTAPSKPTLTSTPTTTTNDTQSIEVNGEVAATVWINGVETGTIGVDGNTTIILDTSGEDGTKTFSIVLKDGSGNASEALGLSIETTTAPIPNTAPLITGTAKTTTNIYATYQFLPITSDVNNDTLTFSIQNKPTWAEFNTTTGRLKGVTFSSDEGNYSNIIISVSDATETVSLSSFSIEVKAALNLASLYGKATQPPKNGYAYYAEPSRAIDGNKNTHNHTQCTAPNNWLQIELPSETKVHKVVLYNRPGQQARLNGSTVYLSGNNYTGTEEVNSTDSLVTLNSDMIQTIEPSTIEGSQYLLIKGSTSCLHLREVEVYGELPPTPDFKDRSTFTVTIDKWQSKTQSIFDANGIDYQDDSIVYAIDGDVPFVISDDGQINVSDLLTVGDYTFDIVLSDGVNMRRKPISITVVATTIVKEVFRTNDNQPELSGLLPNIYNDNDSVSVEINGVTYIAIVNNGMWEIEDDTISPVLAVGLYDVTLTINGTEILYVNYFEVYAERMQSMKKSLLLETIADVPVTVAHTTITPLVKDERVRGNSVRLYVENGVVKLENKSYRTFASLLGKYEDGNGDSIFVKLNFSENIKPYSDNNLSAFAHDSEMKIVITASHFNGQFSFGGTDCFEAAMGSTKYCTPTSSNDIIYSDTAVQNDALSEQALYSITLATYNHYFNSIDGLKMMRAWVEKSTYKNMNFTGNYQSIDGYIGDEEKMSYLYRNFYNFTMPNHHVSMRAMRYKYAAQGMASVTSPIPLDGSKSSSGWASIWEGTIDLSGSGDYETILHEIGHTYSYGHNTGMSYGWPYAFKKVVDTLYVVKQSPVVHVPKYVFETKTLSSTETKIIVHNTIDANEDEMTFELLSSTPLIGNDLTISSSTDDNSVILTNNTGIVTRLFIRVYGDDSREIASKLLVLN